MNFGHVAVHRTAVTAKALTEDYYDQEIARSYFAGCSRGGGQALMEAQRYPEDFEGIVAAAPAYNWTHELGARWIRNAQRMYPDPTQIEEPVIGSEALKLIGDAVMAQCDDLDGLSDGVLNDPRQCDFDVSSLACGDTTSNMCLSPEQVDAAEAIYDDFEIDGQVIPGTPVGAELPGLPVGWELWLTGGYESGEDLDYHEGADSDEFTAPATPNGSWAFSNGIFRFFLYNDPDWSYAGYDFADFSEKAARVGPTLNADNPDLSVFRARGGKLIIDNGWMDGSMSAYGTIKYYKSVLDFDPTAHEDVRLFIRPGRPPIVASVQDRTAPTTLSRSMNGWKVERHRNNCPHCIVILVANQLVGAGFCVPIPISSPMTEAVIRVTQRAFPANFHNNMLLACLSLFANRSQNVR